MLKAKPKTAGKILMLKPDEIRPSPYQARVHFDQTEIAALALSIAENGLLQPVTVRRIKDGYELVAGERRLRACVLAGLERVPAILREYEDSQTAALGLLENLQRQGLDPFEQARGIREVIALWDCTQEEAAQRLGMAQPTLNNKLRLLALTKEQQDFCLEQRLTERHARAVLRLEDEKERSLALAHMARQGMNARQADAYVKALLEKSGEPKRRRIPMVRDVRIFVNTVNRAVKLMLEAGIPASARRTDGEDYVEYVVRIPTGAAGGQ